MIRTGDPGDGPALARLTIQLGYDITADEARRRLVQILGRADQALLVVEDSGQVAGYIHVCVVETLEHEPRGEIRTLVVDERYRSRQLGGRLLEAAEEWASKRGIKRVRVRCNIKRERAHGFYRRHGYTVTKTQHVFDRNLAGER